MELQNQFEEAQERLSQLECVEASLMQKDEEITSLNDKIKLIEENHSVVLSKGKAKISEIETVMINIYGTSISHFRNVMVFRKQ